MAAATASLPHPPQFDTGPPGLDWLFPETETSGPDWFVPTSAEARLQASASLTQTGGRVFSRPVQSTQTAVHSARRSVRVQPVRGVARKRPAQGTSAAISPASPRPRPTSPPHIQTQCALHCPAGGWPLGVERVRAAPGKPTANFAGSHPSPGHRCISRRACRSEHFAIPVWSPGPDCTPGFVVRTRPVATGIGAGDGAGDGVGDGA